VAGMVVGRVPSRVSPQYPLLAIPVNMVCCGLKWQGGGVRGGKGQVHAWSCVLWGLHQ